MKKVKQKLVAEWEIISTAEYVDSLTREVNDDDLVKIYKGNFVQLLVSGRVERKQNLDSINKTVAQADDGTIHGMTLADIAN